ncbi:hypothetical protein H2198_008167 [Neophaeococcomyces mojaviensis]|uniref:Uncharacterized protein n=1 Tax=Neophaeococcomyces mojaviensis TaxID=3383035 RepID=A0ACC2ZY64_9EURO|nr:hypothetical protein H2198_008167 [Knufia sp. JES_112]
MDNEGWHYFDNHKEMEDLFWTTFVDEVGAGRIMQEDKERIKLARLVGIALRYGFEWDNKKTFQHHELA